jgi:hypothetical protein
MSNIAEAKENCQCRGCGSEIPPSRAWCVPCEVTKCHCGAGIPRFRAWCLDCEQRRKEKKDIKVAQPSEDATPHETATRVAMIKLWYGGGATCVSCDRALSNGDCDWCANH